MIPAVTQSSNYCQVIPSCLGGNSPLLKRVQSEWKEIFLSISTVLAIAALAVSILTGSVCAALCYGALAIASMVGFRLVRQVKELKPLEECVTILRENTADQKEQIIQFKGQVNQLKTTREELSSQVDHLKSEIHVLENATEEIGQQVQIFKGLVGQNDEARKSLHEIKEQMAYAQARLSATQDNLELTETRLSSSQYQLDVSNKQLSDITKDFKGLHKVIQHEIKQLIQLNTMIRNTEHSQSTKLQESLQSSLEDFNHLLERFEVAAVNIESEPTSPPRTIFPRLSASDYNVSYASPPPVYRQTEPSTHKKIEYGKESDNDCESIGPFDDAEMI